MYLAALLLVLSALGAVQLYNDVSGRLACGPWMVPSGGVLNRLAYGPWMVPNGASGHLAYGPLMVPNGGVLNRWT
jgi:hypothetical protein